jgi:DNA-binding transcriptional MerR regulator
MNDNKRIFETIIDVLRKANIGFSINEVKDIFFEQKKDDSKEKEEENDYLPHKKSEV